MCNLDLQLDVYQETYCVEMRQGVLDNVIVKATENYCSLPLTKPLPEKKGKISLCFMFFSNPGCL